MTASRTQSRFLDLRALAALAAMRFTTRHRIDGAYAGRHRSRQKGGSGEFVDTREYVPGEDLRWLDWKVLGRTGRAYIRLFQEETNLICTLVVDASASMAFGGRQTIKIKPPATFGAAASPFAVTSAPTGSKLEYVQHLATALSEIISRGKDQVGLAVVADGLSEYLPPASSTTHVRHLQARVEALTTRPATRLAAALDTLFQRVRRRGVLLVMSDFLDDDLDRVFAAVRLFRHRRWEVIFLHIVHPDEERLPAGVAYRFSALEGNARVDCTPAEIRDRYVERFEAHCTAVRSLALAVGCDYRRVSTGVPYLETLGGFLITRAG